MLPEPMHCTGCYFQGLGVGAALSLPLGRMELTVARLEVVDVERWDDAREELEAVCV